MEAGHCKGVDPRTGTLLDALLNTLLLVVTLVEGGLVRLLLAAAPLGKELVSNVVVVTLVGGMLGRLPLAAAPLENEPRFEVDGVVVTFEDEDEDVVVTVVEVVL